MKKLILITGLVFAFVQMKSQGNLQFNQVKLLNASETVPNGKVWKVENMVYSTEVVSATAWGSLGYSGTTANEQVNKIILNGNQITVRKSSSQAGNSNANSVTWEMAYPLWLSSGTVIAPGTGVLYINVVEFNVVQ
jgi:hypothetical protein